MGAHTDLLHLPPAARTTSMLLPGNRKFRPNPYSRDIIPEGIGRTTVRLWVGLPHIPPCYDLLPQVLCSRAVDYLPFQSRLCFTQITDYVPKLCCREVAWLLSSCICAAQSLGWQAAACKPLPERERGRDLEKAI